MIKIDTQFAVFLDNRPGTLSRACQALAAAQINILALSVQDSVDHAVVRMIVDRPKEAEQVFARLPAAVQRRDVVFMDVPNPAGAIAHSAASNDFQSIAAGESKFTRARRDPGRCDRSR